MQPTGKRPSLADIAKQAGLSRNGVSLALRGDASIPEATRRRVREIAGRLGYVADPAVSAVMARHRKGVGETYRGTFALVNGNTDPQAFERHPTIPLYVAGARRRAAELGYRMDAFHLNEPGQNGKRLRRVFRARGICGMLLVGLMKENRLPEVLSPVWEAFPCVVTGVRTRRPALNFACVDHYILTLRAVEKAVELGYRRPALVLDPVIDGLVDGRFSAGFRTGQGMLPSSDRLEPLFEGGDDETAFARFAEWLKRERPDVLLILYNHPRDWLKRLGWAVPGKIGLIQLEWRSGRAEIAGMNQHNDRTGAAAVEMLAEMVRRGETGSPENPRATLIGPTWEEGASVRPQSGGSSRSRVL
ncbi:MAG: LacI family DNA-binding transcriptional regulator [Puniceicoccaceae bacterium]